MWVGLVSEVMCVGRVSVKGQCVGRVSVVNMPYSFAEEIFGMLVSQ